MDRPLQAVLAAMGSFFVASLILFTILVICRGASERRRVESSISRDRSRNRARARTRKKTELSSVGIDESASFDPALNRIAMQELIHATRNFSADLIIGDGSFGLVYKAQLTSGCIVAVKKLSADAFQGFREFRAEMETLGKILHPNIVKILGYCATGSERVLIYEFIERGSLDQWLYDTSSSEEQYNSGEVKLWFPLSWNARIKIIRGVAEGLGFMHNLDTPIIHRDIKASNVLLDANFEAHIADFGLARTIERSQSHVSTQIAGTVGYMPPEYFHTTQVTVMGDVYSFGILMLEIVTGRRPNFPFVGEDGREVRLREWIDKMVKQERYMEMVDASISKDGLNESIVTEIFNIGLRCADENLKSRPTMKEVGEELDKILTTSI